MYFVIGDIHGHYKQFENILRHWRPEKEKLVVLGDLIDRGPDSKKCIDLAMKLEKEEGAVVLGGNHEGEFSDWLELATKDRKRINFYYSVNFEKTIQSFFPETPGIVNKRGMDFIVDDLTKYFPEHMEFLKNRKGYLKSDKLLFTHSGCDFDNWKNNIENLSRYGERRRLYSKNNTGLTVIFGHENTRYLNEDRTDNIYISKDRKIGLDGACYKKGNLIGATVDNDGNVRDVYYER